MADGPLGVHVTQPPQDGISSLRFAPTGDFLLAASWDGLAHLYDARQNILRGTYSHGAPLLDATFQDQSVIYSGGLDGTVKRYDFFGHAEQVLGDHDAPVKCVEFLKDLGLVMSGSWDSTLRLWDPRAPHGQNCAALIPLPGKVFTASQTATRLVVGTSGRHVLIFDTRTLRGGQPEMARDSSLKFQTRCICCYPNGTGYALSSIEGRVSMEYFDPSQDARKYAFKCHRRKEGERDVVFPVNAMAFNLQHGTFATGGSDGIVSVWDGENKKRLMQTARHPTSISALAFNPAGDMLAVASSYCYEQGEQDHPPDALFLRPISESEVRPKPRK